MIPNSIAIPALAVLLAGAPILLWQGAPWMIVTGVALAAGAPLMFVSMHWRRGVAVDAHPLLVSIVSGLGCVTIMTAGRRFGPDHGWALGVALAALVLWMLWQRGQRRKSVDRSR